MAKPIRIYWDACAWIAYIAQEKRVLIQGDKFENRFAMCENVLKSAREGKWEIVTSAFTLAEVCKPGSVKSSPASNLPSFFDRSYILTVPVDVSIGRRAQALQMSGLSKLTPPDAIHLASAQRSESTELHTFDAGLLALDGLISLPSGGSIKICKPSENTPMGPLFGD